MGASFPASPSSNTISLYPTICSQSPNLQEAGATRMQGQGLCSCSRVSEGDISHTLDS